MTKTRYSLSGQRVLVTGARGFIGSNLCDRLVSEGADVHGVSRQLVTGPGIRWWQCDMLDLQQLDRLVRRVQPQIVFHLSGKVSAAPQLENVLPIFHSLLTSTVNLLTVLASTNCVRVVLAGSLTEPPPGAVDATPSSPYAAAKWAGDAFGRMFHLLYRAPVVIARCFMTYGPRQHPSKVIPYTISSLVQGVRPQLTSGAWSADWIYISDLIEGLTRAATTTSIEGRTIDLGGGRLTSIREVVERIVAIMGSTIRPEYGAIPDRPAEEVRIADTDYAFEQLEWKPEVTLNEGLTATVRWYKDLLNATNGDPRRTARS